MAKPATVLMFSGQGSQYYQMGRELFRQPGTFRRCLLEMDAFVRQLTGVSIAKCLYEDGHSLSEPFQRMLLTHPAIFMVQFAMAKTLMERNILPDYVLGASAGTFAALAVAGCIGMEEALALVVNQARVVEESCPQGGMIAVLSDPILYRQEILSRNCELAGINFSSHFVVAAKSDRLGVIEAHLRKSNITFQRLPVSYAFHSMWIDPAREPFAVFLRALSRKPAQIPFICCAEAKIRTNISQDYLWTVARQPVRFAATIANLESMAPYRYIDVGPSGVLATFAKHALPPTSSSEVLFTLNPFGQDLRNLESVAARA
jgi:acyl transferase domain-containing protein